ncbi:uroporphyrinogen decarboxylase family protein [Sporomusa termitida]|uniref:Methyltransferase, MtaA/CmuA family n=1 Tax=Sporomusa termitida TaxID=2377 RepID=A0A517DV67_9FIRM|nr:uroporphyrinogen decarboxylase family protein [Sporomusa termitida]QDR81176.1 methyltransferase, MtaA/CmuA family [Sporomusa termitida]
MNNSLFNTRFNRLTSAITLKTPDRVPVILAGDSFFARHMGVSLDKYIEDLEASSQINLKSIAQLGEIDGVQYLAPCVYGLGASTFSRVKLPGRDLPPDAQWQIDEISPMQAEDYDIILDKGFSFYQQQTLAKYLPVAMSDLQKSLAADWGKIAANYVHAGIVPFSPLIFGGAFDVLSSARGMANLTKDLYRMPDKLDAVLAVITTDIIAKMKARIEQLNPFAVFTGATRCAPEYMSVKMWERFALPSLKKQVQAVIDSGAYALLHWDNNWTRAIEYLKEFPKGKCILASDSNTDLYRAKTVLNGHMCVMGDIPAALLTLGTPDEVYQYSSKLVNDLGPAGYILAVGCCTPLNAKPENIKAMIAAATGN